MKQKNLLGLSNMFNAARLSLESSLDINPKELVEVFIDNGAEPEWSEAKKLRLRLLSGYSTDSDDKLSGMVDRIEGFLSTFRALENVEDKKLTLQEINLAVIHTHSYFNKISKVISNLLDLNQQPIELVEFYIEQVGTRYINCLVELVVIHRAGLDDFQRKRITNYIHTPDPLGIIA